MTAVRKGNSWVLNGTKTFCTNGHYADVVVVIAVTDRAAHTHGLSAFIVEKETKGFRPGKKENKLGLRASDTAELIFEDCVIPAENLLRQGGRRIHRRHAGARRRPHFDRGLVAGHGARAPTRRR